MVTLKDYLGALVTGIKSSEGIGGFRLRQYRFCLRERSIIEQPSGAALQGVEIEITIPVAIDHLEEIIAKDYQPFAKRSI
ncbi:MAG: hypothetical protein IPN33_24155 [Saprospiraceae bacterium]|nr:hypothetical protein [Saprospiraceae bacterium]